MDCAAWCEELSAEADGEPTSVGAEAIDRHLATCDGCRAFADAVGRPRAVLASVEDMPDLSRSVSRAVARHDRRSAHWLLRGALLACAAAVAVQAVPQMVGEQRVAGPGGALFHAPVSHDTRHAGAFGVALAVGLLVVALRPARARTMLPVALMAVAALVGTAVLDVVDGQVTIFSERQHLPEIVALVLVWVLARTTTRRPAPPAAPAVRPQLVVVDDEAPRTP